MITALHIYSLVSALGGNGSVLEECERVLDRMPAIGTEVLVVEMRSGAGRGEGEIGTRVFVAKMHGINRTERVNSSQVLVEGAREMRWFENRLVISDDEHTGYGPYGVDDMIGSYMSGSGVDRRYVVLYERTPANSFLVARLLREQSIVREHAAEIETLNKALERCAVPESVRELARVLTPSAVGELLAFVHESTKAPKG